MSRDFHHGGHEPRTAPATSEADAGLTELHRIERVLAENGVGEPGSDLHSWRCSHPDRYGPCTCLAELVAELVTARAAGSGLAERDALIEYHAAEATRNLYDRKDLERRIAALADEWESVATKDRVYNGSRSSSLLRTDAVVRRLRALLDGDKGEDGGRS